MTKYEYKRESLDSICGAMSTVEEMARDGWDLVSVNNESVCGDDPAPVGYFKREVKND